MENEVLDNVKNNIQIVLNKVFKSDSPYRRKIDIYPDRYNFCCPVCGDSVSDNRKKRGNLYLDSMSYHCYNCGCHFGINSFLKRFNLELSDGDKVKIHDIQQNSKKFEKRTCNSQSSIIYTLLDSLAVPKKVFFNSNKLIPPYKNEFCSVYLTNRKIPKQLWKYFAFNPKTQELYILNISPQDRIIGYQIRQLDKNSKKPRYLTRCISKMYNDLFGRELEVIVNKLLLKETGGEKYIEQEDGIENITANLDRLSCLFNIMNININRTLTIVEGPIDSLFIDNCVALQGATKMNNYWDNVNGVRYLFDNDNVGRKHTINKLREHKTVFLWDSYLKKVKCEDKIKDMNDLEITGNYRADVFDECFSNNELDIIMV